MMLQKAVFLKKGQPGVEFIYICINLNIEKPVHLHASNTEKPIYKVCKKPENHEGNVLPELVRNRGQVGLLAGDSLWCSGRLVWSQGQ